MTSQAERDKLAALAERISKAEAVASGGRKDGDDSQASDVRNVRFVRIGTDFLATVLAGLGLGWFVDDQFGTAPWGLIGLVVAGFAVACYELVIAVARTSSGEGQSKE